MKKKLTYSDSIKLEYTFFGVIFIISGILGFVDGIIATIASAVSFVICLYVMVRCLVSKREKPDEMATENLNRAKALAMDIMLLVYCVLAIAGSLLALHVDIPIKMTTLLLSGCFIILGANKFLIGLLYTKYEEE